MSIPASRIVTINPSAIGGGGNPLSMNTLLIQSGSVLLPGVGQFGSAAEVGEYFGLASDEYKFAQRYFLGYDGATSLPSTLYIVKNGESAQPAFVVGAPLRDLSLADIQAVSGDLVITIDGVETTVSIDLSAATSFSDAASIIDTALAANGTCEFNANMQRFEISSATTGLASTI